MSVTVPDLLQEVTTEAVKILQSKGFHWKLSGDPAQHSIVQDQSPKPGATVEAGSVIELYVLVSGDQGPRRIDDDDIPGNYNVRGVNVSHEPVDVSDEPE